MGGVFCGVMGFCDDLLLLAPSRDAMELMLKTCEVFAKNNGLQFSTDPNPSKSKTKCIFVCGQNKRLKKPVPLQLDGKELPWVPSGNHLGHEIHETGTMDSDVRMKKAAFIQDSTQIRDMFHFASPVEVLQAIKTFSAKLYGSMLWSLRGEAVKQMWNTWNTCVKLTWQVPRETHTYFIDHLLDCGISDLRTHVFARTVKFHRSLRTSPSSEVRVVANMVTRDVRSPTGSNIALIEDQLRLSLLNTTGRAVREACRTGKKDVPAEDSFRIPLLEKLLMQRGEQFYQLEDTTELTDQINSLCIN